MVLKWKQVCDLYLYNPKPTPEFQSMMKELDDRGFVLQVLEKP